MSRCVALDIAESSGQFYLSRGLNIRHRDRETVERDSGYSHRDRLSPRNETNRNVSLAVLYMEYIHEKSKIAKSYLDDVLQTRKTVLAFLYPRHTKYVEGCIVFVFPSIHPSVRLSVCRNVNILCQSFA